SPGWGKSSRTVPAGDAPPVVLVARSGGHDDAAALGRAPAVGMAETFHYLLTLDSSVLDRGRDARQFPISAPTAHEDESKHPARPLGSTGPACADWLVTVRKSVKTRTDDQPKTR